MRVLVDMSHPADVHLFKHTMWELEERGHTTHVLFREREDMIGTLLDEYGFSYTEMLRNQKGLMRKALALPINDVLALKYIVRFNPDVILGHAAPYVAHARILTRTPYLVYEDTEVATINLMISIPFATRILVHTGFQLEFGPAIRKRVERVPACKELAYLHPSRFTPDASIRKDVGIEDGQRSVLIRYSARDSHHDIGVEGLDHSERGIVKLVKALEPHAKVMVQSEFGLPDSLREHELRIDPHRIHDLLSQISLYVGEGSTMAAEAGVLGIPWIFISNQVRGQLQEMEDVYGLGYIVPDQGTAVKRAVEVLKDPGLEADWAEKRERMLSEKIDLTTRLVELVEEYDGGRTA